MSREKKPDDRDEWDRRGYPLVQFITYAYDDPDDAPVLDVSRTVADARRHGSGGFMYRVERLPETTWADPSKPEYGNEKFQCIR